LCGYIQRWGPEVVFLQETKWGSYVQRLGREVGGGGIGEFIALDAVGRAGGVVVRWKGDVFS
jgi:hypothetical protein